jgi:ATP-dependent Clp protease ATP-binding subunit ClpX
LPKGAQSNSELKCSFCHKSQDVVGKLISSPSDYPRAYICDECIAVCNSIMEDDKPEHALAKPGHAPVPPDPTSDIFVLRRDIHLLLDDVPDSDIPTVAKILQGLISP